MKTMADIRRILELYELYGTFNRVARELDISHNTVKKYVLRIKSVQEGSAPYPAVRILENTIFHVNNLNK